MIDITQPGATIVIQYFASHDHYHSMLLEKIKMYGKTDALRAKVFSELAICPGTKMAQDALDCYIDALPSFLITLPTTDELCESAIAHYAAEEYHLSLIASANGLSSLGPISSSSESEDAAPAAASIEAILNQIFQLSLWHMLNLPADASADDGKPLLMHFRGYHADKSEDIAAAIHYYQETLKLPKTDRLAAVAHQLADKHLNYLLVIKKHKVFATAVDSETTRLYISCQLYALLLSKMPNFKFQVGDRLLSISKLDLTMLAANATALNSLLDAFFAIPNDPLCLPLTEEDHRCLAQIKTLLDMPAESAASQWVIAKINLDRMVKKQTQPHPSKLLDKATAEFGKGNLGAAVECYLRASEIDARYRSTYVIFLKTHAERIVSIKSNSAKVIAKDYHEIAKPYLAGDTSAIIQVLPYLKAACQLDPTNEEYHKSYQAAIAKPLSTATPSTAPFSVRRLGKVINALSLLPKP
jgi:hypothetical protein